MLPPVSPRIFSDLPNRQLLLWQESRKTLRAHHPARTSLSTVDDKKTLPYPVRLIPAFGRHPLTPPIGAPRFRFERQDRRASN